MQFFALILALSALPMDVAAQDSSVGGFSGGNPSSWFGSWPAFVQGDGSGTTSGAKSGKTAGDNPYLGSGGQPTTKSGSNSIKRPGRHSDESESMSNAKSGTTPDTSLDGNPGYQSDTAHGQKQGNTLSRGSGYGSDGGSVGGQVAPPPAANQSATNPPSSNPPGTGSGGTDSPESQLKPGPLVLGGQDKAVGPHVVGTPDGFARGTTGGGNTPPVYPKTNQELLNYLADNVTRVIMIDREFDFTDFEGKKTSPACHPRTMPCGPKNGGQLAIDYMSWCENYAQEKPSTSVTYNAAGEVGLYIGSNKSVLGVGNKGIITGKGLRTANRASNIIIQNLHVRMVNPQYIWGGDAITIDSGDQIWIDHVTTTLIGRQHYHLINGENTHLTISNSELNGTTAWSASCDSHQYWSILVVGNTGSITFKNNWMHETSGRAPKIGGSTIFHAVNNYWDSNTGHAFDVDVHSTAIIEGNVFENVKTPLLTPVHGSAFVPTAQTASQCRAALGRDCILNVMRDSGPLAGSQTEGFSHFHKYQARVKNALGLDHSIPRAAGFAKNNGGSLSS